jgi:hypothetical protein
VVNRIMKDGNRERERACVEADCRGVEWGFVSLENTSIKRIIKIPKR